jgi:hypothetical protein
VLIAASEDREKKKTGSGGAKYETKEVFGVGSLTRLAQKKEEERKQVKQEASSTKASSNTGSLLSYMIVRALPHRSF